MAKNKGPATVSEYFSVKEAEEIVMSTAFLEKLAKEGSHLRSRTVQAIGPGIWISERSFLRSLQPPVRQEGLISGLWGKSVLQRNEKARSSIASVFVQFLGTSWRCAGTPDPQGGKRRRKKKKPQNAATTKKAKSTEEC